VFVGVYGVDTPRSASWVGSSVIHSIMLGIEFMALIFAHTQKAACSEVNGVFVNGDLITFKFRFLVTVNHTIAPLVPCVGYYSAIGTTLQGIGARMDPVTALSAISAAAQGISAVVNAGRDLGAAQDHIKKWALAEAQLDTAKAAKQSGWRAALGGVESSVIDEHFKKREVAELRDQLRQLMLVYGKPGEWEALCAEIARAKKEHKDAIAAQQKRRADIMHNVVLWSLVTLGTALAIGLLAVFLYGLRLRGVI